MRIEKYFCRRTQVHLARLAGGVARGASVVFFAYIGFDAVSTGASEAKNPQKDMPIPGF